MQDLLLTIKDALSAWPHSNCHRRRCVAAIVSRFGGWKCGVRRCKIMMQERRTRWMNMVLFAAAKFWCEATTLRGARVWRDCALTSSRPRACVLCLFFPSPPGVLPSIYRRQPSERIKMRPWPPEQTARSINFFSLAASLLSARPWVWCGSNSSLIKPSRHVCT
jgi:hypothetical protein